MIAQPATPLRRTLTTRQTEVVELLAEGLSNKQIADRLGISEHTAHFHVNSVLSRLRARTRAHAVAIHLGRAS